MLRCAGDILAECVTAPWLTARTGGDEFVILMPGADEHDGIRLMVRVQSAISAANQARKGLPLSLSLGAATRRPEEPLEITVHRADAHMYEAKRQYYAINQCDRRSRAAWVSVAATKPCWPPSLAMPLTETGYNQQRKC
jgi:diguanylate cyclase (GGDEF)-like protein